MQESKVKRYKITLLGKMRLLDHIFLVVLPIVLLPTHISHASITETTPFADYGKKVTFQF